MRSSCPLVQTALALLLSVSFACAGSKAPATPAAPPEPTAPPAEAAATLSAEETSAEETLAEETSAEETPAEETPAEPAPKKRSLRDLCRQTPEKRDLVDDARRVLEETFCGATLWFDGLFGDEPNVENARSVSGRVELSALHTDFDGTDFKGRLKVRYDLPNLDRRVNIFLGRDDRDEIVEDRREGFAVRSSVFGLETEEQWLAGLGWSPPGHYASKLDVRVGGRVKSSPEIFAQTRYRHHLFVGTRDVWRFRETVFWENRDGFGSTTSLDFDRVVSRDLLFRFANVGTVSEATRGLSWRSAALLYHNLRQTRAVAGELFIRGSTASDVELREYGGRGVYRQQVGHPNLFGELILGYTWPRERLDQRREGSMMIGLGIELLFGRDPY